MEILNRYIDGRKRDQTMDLCRIENLSPKYGEGSVIEVSRISSPFRDPNDNPILAAAVAYRCEFLVTPSLMPTD